MLLLRDNKSILFYSILSRIGLDVGTSVMVQCNKQIH